MLKDIRGKFLAGPRKFDEIMEKLEIIINEMMVYDGPVPMDLGSVGVHDAGMMQSGQDMSNDMSYDDRCAIDWEQERKDQTDQERGNVEKEVMNGRVTGEMVEAGKEARKTAWAASLTGVATKTWRHWD